MTKATRIIQTLKKTLIEKEKYMTRYLKCRLTLHYSAQGHFQANRNLGP